VAGRILKDKNPINTIGNRTRNLPACSAVPQSAAPPRDTKVGITSRLHRQTKVSSQLHALVALPPEKQSPVPTEQQAARGLQTAWTFCGTEKSLSPAGNRTTIPSSPRPNGKRRPNTTQTEHKRRISPIRSTDRNMSQL